MARRLPRYAFTAAAALTLSAALVVLGARVADAPAASPSEEDRGERELALMSYPTDAVEVLDSRAETPDAPPAAPAPELDTNDATEPEPAPSEPDAEGDTPAELAFTPVPGPGLQLGPAPEPGGESEDRTEAHAVGDEDEDAELEGIPLHQPGGLGAVKRGWVVAAGGDPDPDAGRGPSFTVITSTCPSDGRPTLPLPNWLERSSG